MLTRKKAFKLSRSPGLGKQPARTETGFTIIESLMAIVVVTLLMVGISPMLAVAVAIRVQARRVEIGTQAAKSYVDFLATRPDPVKYPEYHPKVNKSATPEKGSDAPTPSGPSLPCDNGSYCNSDRSLYCVDGDGTGKCENDSSMDMLVQGVAYNNTGAPQDGYELIVRVYRADAFNGGTIVTNRTQSTVTAGLGDRYAPLAQVRTEISTSATTFEDYQKRLPPP